MGLLRTGGALVFLVAQTLVASAASISSYVSKEGNVIVVLKGEITPGDDERLTSIVKTSNAANQFVSGIRLSSPGGNLAEGVMLANTVREAKMAAVVPNGSQCASACFLIFAAGIEKFASYSAQIGVHGASENGQETSGSSAATISMARIVKDLGVPAAIIGRMVVTPPGDMVWLSPSDLRTMGTTLTGKPSQVPPVASASAAPIQQLPPAVPPETQANAVPTWEGYINKAAAYSAAQNNGTPRFTRVCQPEIKLCSMALFYVDDNKNSMMARTTEDIDGKLISREVCKFNTFGDVRKCINWDTSVSRTDMKDAKGAWSQVAN